jgi:hypothetical protein
MVVQASLRTPVGWQCRHSHSHICCKAQNMRFAESGRELSGRFRNLSPGIHSRPVFLVSIENIPIPLTLFVHQFFST